MILSYFVEKDFMYFSLPRYLKIKVQQFIKDSINQKDQYFIQIYELRDKLNTLHEIFFDFYQFQKHIVVFHVKKQQLVLFADLVEVFFMIDFDIFKKRESYKNACMHDELREFMITKLSWTSLYQFQLTIRLFIIRLYFENNLINLNQQIQKKLYEQDINIMFDRLKIINQTLKQFNFWQNFGSIISKILQDIQNIETFDFFNLYFQQQEFPDFIIQILKEQYEKSINQQNVTENYDKKSFQQDITENYDNQILNTNVDQIKQQNNEITSQYMHEQKETSDPIDNQKTSSKTLIGTDCIQTNYEDFSNKEEMEKRQSHFLTQTADDIQESQIQCQFCESFLFIEFIEYHKQYCRENPYNIAQIKNNTEYFIDNKDIQLYQQQIDKSCEYSNIQSAQKEKEKEIINQNQNSEISAKKTNPSNQTAVDPVQMRYSRTVAGFNVNSIKQSLIQSDCKSQKNSKKTPKQLQTIQEQNSKPLKNNRLKNIGKRISANSIGNKNNKFSDRSFNNKQFQETLKKKLIKLAQNQDFQAKCSDLFNKNQYKQNYTNEGTKTWKKQQIKTMTKEYNMIQEFERQLSISQNFESYQNEEWNPNKMLETVFSSQKSYLQYDNYGIEQNNKLIQEY